MVKYGEPSENPWLIGSRSPAKKNRFHHSDDGSGSLRVWINRLLAITTTLRRFGAERPSGSALKISAGFLYEVLLNRVRIVRTGQVTGVKVGRTFSPLGGVRGEQQACLQPAAFRMRSSG